MSVAFLVGLLAIGAVIVGVHEAGHAVVAVALGFDDVHVRWFPPRTSYAGTRRAGRLVLVSLAGPAANAVLGAMCWVAGQTALAGHPSLAGAAYAVAFFSVLFGASNLVPVPGSDGWTALAAMLHGLRR